MRVIAGAIILLFLYYAAGVVITLLLSVLIAYFLDPAVEFLERFRVPRTIGALVMVLILIAVICAVGYSVWTRADDFAADWPKYKTILKDAAGSVQTKIRGFEGSVTEITSQGDASKAPAPASSGDIVHSFLVRGIGSLYALVLEGTFVPFLVFFMLAQKREVWHGTLQLFPVNRRTQVKETLEDLRDVPARLPDRHDRRDARRRCP